MRCPKFLAFLYCKEAFSNLQAGLKIIQSYMEGYRQDWKLSFEGDTVAKGGWYVIHLIAIIVAIMRFTRSYLKLGERNFTLASWKIAIMSNIHLVSIRTFRWSLNNPENFVDKCQLD